MTKEPQLVSTCGLKMKRTRGSDGTRPLVTPKQTYHIMQRPSSQLQSPPSQARVEVSGILSRERLMTMTLGQALGSTMKTHVHVLILTADIMLWRCDKHRCNFSSCSINVRFSTALLNSLVNCSSIA